MMSSINNRKILNIGLFGFGTVGKGLWDVLQKTPGLQASIRKICIKNPHKKRDADASFFTTDASDILNNSEINVVVELIDDAGAAFDIVRAALLQGKSVVTANKKMVAEHFSTLVNLQREFGGSLLYEGACCAGIPIIRNLEEYYDNDTLSSIQGIINGSTNYILTQLSNSNLNFKEALLEAQQLGYAESNPSLDIDGHDAANKLSILIAHAFGEILQPADILYTGITGIRTADARLAAEKNYKIKLVATAIKIRDESLGAFVLPQFVSAENELYHVDAVFNGLVTTSSFADKHFFKGKGAGAYPTAAAVLSDISALSYGYRYEYKKQGQKKNEVFGYDYHLRIYVSAGDATLLDKNKFDWIEEWHEENQNTWAIGCVSARSLKEDNWWKQPGVSLILCEDAIIEDFSYREIHKKSLELAGVVAV